LPTYANPMDRYLKAGEQAMATARDHAMRVKPMETELRPPLPREAQQAMYDRYYRPLLDAGKVEDALALVAKQAPVGTEPRQELERLVRQFDAGPAVTARGGL
jgi:hypothetical protein